MDLCAINMHTNVYFSCCMPVLLHLSIAALVFTECLGLHEDKLTQMFSLTQYRMTRVKMRTWSCTVFDSSLTEAFSHLSTFAYRLEISLQVLKNELLIQDTKNK